MKPLSCSCHNGFTINSPILITRTVVPFIKRKQLTEKTILKELHTSNEDSGNRRGRNIGFCAWKGLINTVPPMDSSLHMALIMFYITSPFPSISSSTSLNSYLKRDLPPVRFILDQEYLPFGADFPNLNFSVSAGET